MLSSLRQATSRALPRLSPRYARPITTKNVSDQDKETLHEAMSVFDLDDPFTAAKETTAISTPPPPNLDMMHHHVPPPESPMLHFLTTMIMRHGLYAQAAKVTSQMLLHIHAMTRSPPMPIVEHAILAASPSVRCRRQKQRGGKATLVPMALSERQRTHLGILWIREAAEKKSSPGKKLEERLAREMIAVLKGTSSALENKDKMHKEAMVNRGLLSRRG